MNTDQLYAALTDARYLSAGTLALPAGVFGPGDVQSLITTWFGGRLVITQVGEVRRAGDTVVLDGQMSLLGTNNRPVSGVTFGLLDAAGRPAAEGSPSLLLVFPLPAQEQGRADWKFSDTFPALSGTPLEQLTFLAPVSFVFSSASVAASGDRPALSPGLNFFAPRVKTNGPPVSDIGPLLGGRVTVPLSGPINILSGDVNTRDRLLPGILLRSDLNDGGFLGASFFLQAVARRKAGADGNYYVGLLASAELSIGSAPPITLSADFGNMGRVLVLQADLDAAVSYTLTALSEWLQNAPLGGVFDGFDFDLGSVVTLRQLRLFINTRKLSSGPLAALSAVSLTVGTPQTKSWDIVGGYFRLDGIAVTFMVNNPLGGGTGMRLNTIVEGDVTLLEGIDLAAWGSFPEASFGLSTVKPVRFQQIFERMNLNLTGFPDLTCENFYVEATPPSGPFALSTTVTSDWAIDIGVRQIQLTQASLFLQYENSSFGGEVAATAKLLPKNGDAASADVPTFRVDWQIHGPFVLQGTFPDIGLTDLARAIAGEVNLSLPPGFPDLHLKNSKVSLTVKPGQPGNQPTGTSYDFTLTTTVTVGNASGLTLVAELLKTDKGTGLVAGIWTDNWSWSPADLPGWGDTFGLILGGIEFKRSGLIVSSLEQTKLTFEGAPTDLPQDIKRGLTFFTEIGFGTSALTVLKHFFGEAPSVKLYALIGSPLDNSMFVAKIGDTSTTNRYAFTGLQLMVSPATKSFALQAGVSFTFRDLNGKDVQMTFIGGGRVTLAGEFEIYFVLKAQSVGDDAPAASTTALQPAPGSAGPPAESPGWKDPLGINGLTIQNFWGMIGVGSTGLTLGFGGSIIIDDVYLELAIVGGFEGEVPYVEVFKFEIAAASPGQAIKISLLVRQFTSLDPSLVPLLDEIQLKEFMVMLVLAPLGWTNPATQQMYQAGFYTRGDVLFFGFELVFDIRVYFQRGIAASGYVDKPLVLGDGVFKLTDASGQKGPRGSIDTTALTGGGGMTGTGTGAGASTSLTTTDGTSNTYLSLSGSLTLLGMSATIEAYVKNDAFLFRWKAKEFIFEQEVICSLTKSQGFYASATGSLNLDIDTGSAVTVAGVEIIPRIHISLGLALNVEIKIDPGFSFVVTGTFRWGSQTLSISVGLQIRSWSELKDLLKKYFEDYPKELFRDIINSAEKWAKAVGEKLIQVAEDAAKVLKDVYKVLDEKVAAELLKAMNYTYDQAVKALEDVWKVASDEAKQLAGKVWEEAKKCAATTATMHM